MSYARRLLEAYTASMASISIAVILVSFASEMKTALPVIEAPVLFHFLVVAPSEELMFRFFLPVALMYATGMGYLASGMISSVVFGLAHYWAYQANAYALIAAIAAGGLQTLIVHIYGFSPGLLGAILGHASYNCVVALAPGLLVPVAVAYALAFALLNLSKGRWIGDT